MENGGVLPRFAPGSAARFPVVIVIRTSKNRNSNMTVKKALSLLTEVSLSALKLCSGLVNRGRSVVV
jgi:hypothetical protein